MMISVAIIKIVKQYAEKIWMPTFETHTTLSLSKEETGEEAFQT